MWLAFAFGSALFAGLTSVLAKVGVRDTDSNLATAIRTIVVVVMSWLMVFLVGSQAGLATLSGTTVLFLVLSGLATGASWLCYFRALQLGTVNHVVPVDRTSLGLTVLFAIVLLGETQHLATRLPGLALVGVGTWLMVRDGAQPPAASESPAVRSWAWLPFAIGSAVFAALTAILGKIGITGVESNLGTAIRTVVVLVMAWLVVAVSGRGRERRTVPRRDLWFILASGVATGASWLCYFHALQDGPASLVAPVDKLSIVFAVGFSALVLGERLTRRAALGLLAIVAGTLLMLL